MEAVIFMVLCPLAMFQKKTSYQPVSISAGWKRTYSPTVPQYTDPMSAVEPLRPLSTQPSDMVMPSPVKLSLSKLMWMVPGSSGSGGSTSPSSFTRRK